MDTIPPPPPLPVKTYRRIQSADELPSRLRVAYEKARTRSRGEVLEPWQFQPDPPGPEWDSRLEPRLKIGELSRSGYPTKWPNLQYIPDAPDVEPCVVCGLRHVDRHGNPSCAHHTHLGLPCRQIRIRGVSRCRIHCGVTVDKAHKKLARKKLEDSIRDVEVEPIGNPIDHLAGLAAEQLAWKDHLASVVGELRDSYRFTDDKGAEQLDARVDLYTKSMGAAQKHLLDLTKIGFEEQRLRLEERRAALVVEFAIALIERLGRKPDEPEVSSILEQLLPVLDGEPVPDALPAASWEDEEE